MNRGFTLIEVLLYVVITTIVLVSVSAFLSLLMAARAKDQAINEIEGQGLAAMQTIEQDTRNALSINSPATGTNASMLSLAVAAGASDPTIFGVQNGVLGIKEGVAATTTLTNSRVMVSNFTVQNLSSANGTGTVRIRLTLSSASPSSRYEFTYSKTFTGSATVRQ